MKQNFSNALRVLRTRPAFSSAIVIMVAIAIGACAAVFGLVDRLILRPLPFPNPSQVVAVEQAWPLFVGGIEGEPASHRDAPYARMASYEFGRATLTAVGPARVVKVAEVGADYFPVLGLAPAKGRLFQGPAESNVVVIGRSLRRILFADDSVAIGQSLVLNGRPFTIVGVAPDAFEFYVRGETVEAWVPRVESRPLVQTNQSMGSGTVARLKPGVSVQRAAAAVDVILARVAANHPELKIRKTTRIEIIALRDHWFGPLKLPLLLLLGAASCLLAIAGANATGLMLARAAARQRENAIRAALGAGRAELLREALAESLVLGGVAAGVGLLLAQWGTRALIFLSPTRIPGGDGGGNDFGVSLTTLAFAIVVALPTTSIAGMVAAWRASRFDLLRTLSAGGRQGSFVSPRLRRILVGAQVAMTVTLLVNATLLLRSFKALRAENTGFDARSVLTMEIAPATARYPGAEARFAYYERLINGIHARHAGASVSIVNYLPLYSGSLMIPVMTPGRTPNEALSWTYRAASAEYFRTMRIPLLAGRAFTEQDRMGAGPVAIVDLSAARQLVNGAAPETAIGKRIVLNFGEPTPFEVVGIAGDIRQQGLGIASYPGFYVSAYQRPPSVANLVMRTADGAELSVVRRTLHEADADLAVSTLHSLESNISDAVSRRRFAIVVVGILGMSALILSLFGLAALMSQLVTFRSHEIGVRVALGARPRDVLDLVIRQGLGMVVIGIAVGLAGALSGARLLRGLLYGVAATDAVAFAVVPAAMIGIAVLACAEPARRALRTDAARALRGE